MSHPHLVPIGVPNVIGHIVHERVDHALERVMQDPRVPEDARVLAETILEEQPALAGFPYAVRGWALSEARMLQAEAWLDVHDMDHPSWHKVAGTVAKLHGLAAQRRKELGLDPMSYAKLSKTLAGLKKTMVELDSIEQRGKS